MVDISQCSNKLKAEIAGFIRQDTLAELNNQVELVTVKDTFYTRYGKRLIDIVVSLIAVILTIPVNLIIGIVTFFDVGRPIMFFQKRIGKDGRLFTIYKFRNMTNAVDQNNELLSPAERVTKWGKFVRKTSLDELLNFVSILKGDMSLVGPRPLLIDYSERFHNRHRQRYAVRPGLECPSVKRLDHPMTWQERLENDVWYVQNCSLRVDILLLWRVFQSVFDRKSTAIRGKAGAGGFLGYNPDGTIITTQCVPEKYCQMYCEQHGLCGIDNVYEAAMVAL